ALELKKKEKEIQDKAKELKSKENELQAKIEQHEKHIQNLELGYLDTQNKTIEKSLENWNFDDIIKK
ncbi:hypothetical protein VWM73_12730, partial [Campylobacter coli]